MKGSQLRTLTLEAPFALFSDVHGNLPGLEAILADIERRGVPQTISLGDLVGYGPSPNEVALARARPRHPQPHGQLRPGHRLRDRRLWLRLQDRRAARRRRGVARVDAAGGDRRGQGLPAHPGRPLHVRDARRRPACRPRQPAAHQRVPLRGPAGEGHGAHGRRVSLPGHLLRAHARALRASRSARPPSSTSAAAGAPRTATGVCATPSSTRRASARPVLSSSCASPTTTSGCSASSLRRR